MKRFSSIRIRNLLLLALYCSSFCEILAYPSYAGHCNKGSISNQSGYIGPHGSQGGGALSIGKYVVKMDGVEISNVEVTTLNVGQEYTFTLEATGTHDFRGFLLRLADMIDVEDTSGAYTVVSTTDAQIHPLCNTKPVSGVTHVDGRNDKRYIEFKVQLNKPVSSMRLDVTVVRNKEFANWFYSLFQLSAVDMSTSEPPSTIPTTSPSTIPTTSPTTIPTTSPTTIPSPAPLPKFCVDSPLRMLHKKKKRFCKKFLATNTEVKCNQKGVHTHCPFTCREYFPQNCITPNNTWKTFYLKNGREVKCAWVKERRYQRCNKLPGVAQTCRKICNKFL